MSSSRVLTHISDTFDDYLFLNHSVQQIVTTGPKPRVSSKKLAQSWGIRIAMASNTIQVTTQKGIRNVTGHIERRLKTKQAHSRYPQIGGRHGRFYMDTFFSAIPTLRTCKCAQLYTNDIGFMKVYPM
jgi:hypothetical protein